MKKQEFEVEIVKVFMPGESFSIQLPQSQDAQPHYESLRVLEEHQSSAQSLQPGDRVKFTGAYIVISGDELKISTSMIITQSPLELVVEELASLTCKINNIIFDDYTGQLFTAKIISSDPELELSYITILPSNILMKGIMVGSIIAVKGRYYQTSLYTPTKRRPTIPIFVVKQFHMVDQ